MNKGYLLVFSTAIISGFAIFVNKFGVKVGNPFIYTFFRVLIVAIFLTGLIFLLKEWQKLKNLTKKQWFLLIIIGLIGGSIPFLLFFKGLSLSEPAKGSFIHKTMFIWTALLASLFLKERISKNFLIGGLLLLLGNGLLLKKLAMVFTRGDLLIFLATFLWATENTISKYTLKDLEGRIVAWGRMFFGAFFILIFLLLSHQSSLVYEVTLKQMLWIFITSLILLGYVITWYSGLKLVPVSQATVILMLGSPITTLLSLIYSGKITFRELSSGILIVLGVVFVIGVGATGQLIKKSLTSYVRS